MRYKIPETSLKEIYEEVKEYYKNKGKSNFIKEFIRTYFSYFFDLFEKWFSGGDAFYYARIQNNGLRKYLIERFK